MPRNALLVIGAGPYGLAIAAYARHAGVQCTIVGEPMGFWKHHMPRQMLLRTGIGWHLDVLETHTFAAYLQWRGLDPASIMPIPVALYLEYAAWFQEKEHVQVLPNMVKTLEFLGDGYEALLSTGERITASAVVVATGSYAFRLFPPEITEAVPPNRYAHTCDIVEFEQFLGKRCLVLGGRQSAYEWAAMIHEKSETDVHVVYPHETPQFDHSDWSWIDKHIEEMLSEPGWFKNLEPTEREAVELRFWEESRLKLEPWLWSRLGDDAILSWPNRSVLECHEADDGHIDVILDNEARLPVDFIVLATGFQVDLRRLTFLSETSILSDLALHSGFPALDAYFQSNLPGLFFAGIPSTRDFGPFFGFVRGCTASAKLIVDLLATAQP